MSIFDGLQSVAEVKILWKNTIFELHPDRHPQEEFSYWNDLTQQLNATYHAALKRLDGATTFNEETKKEYRYTYRYDVEQAVIDKLNETIHAGLPEDLTIWLVGTWIWVENTRKEDKPTHDKLKDMGYLWHGKRQMWYWREKPGWHHTKAGFEALKMVYGAQAYSSQQQEQGLATR